jgi:hypothetical protein
MLRWWAWVLTSLLNEGMWWMIMIKQRVRTKW